MPAMSSYRLESDYVVVGAGAAGAVVAARLARAGHSVILVEAGGPARGPLFSTPLATGVLLRSAIANWRYATEPEPALNGRRIDWPRGKALGGSTAINGMVWMRGLPLDYDGWAAQGAADWNWQAVRPHFEALEAEIARTRRGFSHPLFARFVEAAVAAGHRRIESFNTDGAPGVGPYDFTIRNGRRVSAATAFLKPLAGDDRLRVLMRAQAVRLLIDGVRCHGVLARRGGEEIALRARRETIVSAGTVGTPHLLMLSGLGPADALSRAGVRPLLDLPGVGRNLQDHLLVRVAHATARSDTFDRLRRLDRAALAGFEAWLLGRGPASTFPIEVGLTMASTPGLSQPDLQASFMPGLSSASLHLPFAGMARRADPGRGFFANVFQMRPQSRGEIRLASADPGAAPVIRANYLAEPGDRAALRRGVRLLREVFAQDVWGADRGVELQPGPAVQSDVALDAFIAGAADTVFHPVGTCRMGRADDSYAVVDPQLRLRGVEGLRVADASVMPTITSSNTAAPSMLIGWRAADFILRAEGTFT